MGDYDRRLAQAQDFADGWQRRAEAAEAERDRLRAIVEDPHGAVEAMHRRLDESMSEQAVLMAERDRLRAVVDDATIDATALVAERADLEDEVDRLRAVMDALQTVAFTAQLYLDARSLDPQSPARSDLERAIADLRRLDGSADMGKPEEETPR